MKSILFRIFIIISFSIILSKNLRSSDIFKRSKYHPHSTPNSTEVVIMRPPMTRRAGPPTLPNGHANPFSNSPPFSKKNYKKRINIKN